MSCYLCHLCFVLSLSCYLCHCDVYVYVLSLCVLHANELYVLLISMPCYSGNKVLEWLLAMCLGRVPWCLGPCHIPHPGCYVTVIKLLQAWLLILQFLFIAWCMQMAAPRAAIGMNLATDSGMCTITHVVRRIANQKLLSP